MRFSDVCPRCDLLVTGVGRTPDEAISRFKNNMRLHKSGRRCWSRRKKD